MQPPRFDKQILLLDQHLYLSIFDHSLNYIFPDYHKVFGIAQMLFEYLKHFLTLLTRYSSLGYTEEEKAEVAKQLLSLSQACSQSLKELTSLGVEEEDINVEEEDGGVNELSTISEEQGELWLSGHICTFASYTIHQSFDTLAI